MKPRVQRIFVVVGMATALVLGAQTATAEAHSFAGSCALSGDATWDPPLSFEPASRGFTYKATGRCRGVLDGRQLPAAGAPASTSVLGTTLVDGCGYGFTQRATGVLRVARQRAPAGRPASISFTATITVAASNVFAVLRGASRGKALVHGAPQADAQALVLACAAGTLASVPLPTQLSTVRPLVG